ncbi:cupin domain-containing protein [Chryseolinea sp. T2]|uniref:cupin domain-containing protein n=1 Tax=Chryseolinea sp. T2 TaxID=3129255 RepID=UPI0030770832
MNADYWIEHLKLSAHPEGGFYRETYRAGGRLSVSDNAVRNYSTAIYFLLRKQDRSMFHRIKSDELWHFHAGGRLTIYMLTEGGLVSQSLGQNIEQGDKLQIVIPANHWFGALVTEGPYVLAGCTVSPGFDFSDFEMAKRQELLGQFPKHSDIIQKLT